MKNQIQPNNNFKIMPVRGPGKVATEAERRVRIKSPPKILKTYLFTYVAKGHIWPWTAAKYGRV